jgi:replicative DNA helicase
MTDFRREPFSAQLEETVLLGCVASRDVAEIIMPVVTQEYFYTPINAKLYKAVSQAYKSGSCDPATVSIELDKIGHLEHYGGQVGLVQAMWQGTSYSNAEAHLSELQQYKVKRGVMNMAQSLISQAFDDDMDGFALADKAAEMATKLTETSGILQTASIDEHIRRYHEQDLRPFTIGDSDMLNTLYLHGGLQPGHIDVTIAESGHGKTQYAMYKTKLLALAGYKTHWFQMEDYGGRTAMYFKKALGDKADNVVIVDNVYDIDDIKREARQVKREFGTNNIVIDYVQEITTKGRSRAEEVEVVARSLTSLAKELSVCMHLTSQMTIADTKRKNWQLEPRKNDVRWSKQLKQAASAIIAVFRPFVVEGLSEGENALDWNGNQIHKNLVFCRNIKNRHGEQTQHRLQLIHTDDGLVNYNAWMYQTQNRNNEWRGNPTPPALLAITDDQSPF